MATILVLALLLFMLVASSRAWLAVDVVALTILAVLALTGVVTLDEATSGFSNAAVLTVLLMMILSQAIADSGVMAKIGHGLGRFSGGGLLLTTSLLLLVCGVLSMFVNNTAAIAMFLPVAVQIAKLHRISPSKLLLPLNYAAVIGGTCTLVGTSTNLIVSSIVETHGEKPIRMFELFPMGIVFFACGLLYGLVVIRFLPNRDDPSSLTGKYQLTPYLTELRVPAASRLVGRTVVEERVSDRHRLNVLEIVRGTQRIAFNLRQTAIAADDILIVRGAMPDIVEFKEQKQLLLLSDTKLADSDLADADNVLVEMQLSPSSTLEGQSLREIDFRRRFGAFVLALSRTGELIREKIALIRLKRWDMLLVFGPRRNVEQLLQLDDFLSLQEVDLRLRLDRRWIVRVLALVGTVFATSVFGVPILLSALTAFAFLIASRSVKIQKVYRSVDWSVYFLLAATIPLGIAVEKVGLAQQLGGWIAERGGEVGPWVALSLLYLVGMGLTEVLSNASTAVILVPVAIATAESLGTDLRPFVIAVTFAASNGFVTPIGYQTNAMIYGAGNYRYADFVKAGIPLNLLFWILASVLIPILWPF
ncbi:MAG: SLC13 family permease [Thermoanaerobaculia bacterium]